jgi:hypothetical protein
VTKTDLSGEVRFDTADNLWTGVLSTAEEVRISSTNPEIIQKVEAVVSTWTKQIEEVRTDIQ